MHGIRCGWCRDAGPVRTCFFVLYPIAVGFRRVLYRLRRMLSRIRKRTAQIVFVCRTSGWCGSFGSGFSVGFPYFCRGFSGIRGSGVFAEKSLCYPTARGLPTARELHCGSGVLHGAGRCGAMPDFFFARTMSYDAAKNLGDLFFGNGCLVRGRDEKKKT